MFASLRTNVLGFSNIASNVHLHTASPTDKHCRIQWAASEQSGVTDYANPAATIIRRNAVTSSGGVPLAVREEVSVPRIWPTDANRFQVDRHPVHEEVPKSPMRCYEGSCSSAKRASASASRRAPFCARIFRTILSRGRPLLGNGRPVSLKCNQLRNFRTRKIPMQTTSQRPNVESKLIRWSCVPTPAANAKRPMIVAASSVDQGPSRHLTPKDFLADPLQKPVSRTKRLLRQRRGGRARHK